jgi:hypothetical protein
MQVRRVVAVAGLLLASGIVTSCDAHGFDTCASFLQASPTSVQLGNAVSLHRDAGCDSKSEQHQVRVVVVDSGGRRRPAGSVDLSVTGEVTGTVTIPQDLERGPATIVLQETVQYACDDTTSCAGSATSAGIRLK